MEWPVFVEEQYWNEESDYFHRAKIVTRNSNHFIEDISARPVPEEEALRVQPERLDLDFEREFVRRPSSPTEETEDLNITTSLPTTKKIGFIGLGAIGGRLAQNLIATGHDLTVWSRTDEKRTLYTDLGAKWAKTPADVVAACNVTFSCLSDPETARDLFFGECGMHQGLVSPGKGYVEMTSMDVGIVQQIGQAVANAGGRFLEAYLSGTRAMAQEGTTFILTAGNLELMHECMSCFHMMASHVLFLDRHLGTAAKLNLMMGALETVANTALAESLTFLKRCNTNPGHFLHLLEELDFLGPRVAEQAHAMGLQRYVPGIPLKHCLRDLESVVRYGRALNRPVSVCDRALEMLKKAADMGHAEDDVSAVVEVVRSRV